MSRRSAELAMDRSSLTSSLAKSVNSKRRKFAFSPSQRRANSRRVAVVAPRRLSCRARPDLPLSSPGPDQKRALNVPPTPPRDVLSRNGNRRPRVAIAGLRFAPTPASGAPHGRVQREQAPKEAVRSERASGEQVQTVATRIDPPRGPGPRAAAVLNGKTQNGQAQNDLVQDGRRRSGNAPPDKVRLGSVLTEAQDNVPQADRALKAPARNREPRFAAGPTPPIAKIVRGRAIRSAAASAEADRKELSLDGREAQNLDRIARRNLPDLPIAPPSITMILIRRASGFASRLLSHTLSLVPGVLSVRGQKRLSQSRAARPESLPAPVRRDRRRREVLHDRRANVRPSAQTIPAARLARRSAGATLTLARTRGGRNRSRAGRNNPACVQPKSPRTIQ